MAGGGSSKVRKRKSMKSKKSVRDAVKSSKSVAKSRTSKKRRKARATGSQSKEGKSDKEVRNTQNSKEDAEKEKKSDSKSSLANQAGVKSDQNQSKEGTVGGLFVPPPKGELGKQKLAEMLKDLPEEAPSQAPLSNLVLQKISSIETGAVLDLKSENFFHFFLKEHEVWEKVRNFGEFLVRQLPLDEKENENEQDEYVICVMAKEKPLNIPINFSRARNFCYINGYCFDTPAGLVQYHYRNHIALDENGTRLLTPIMKDSIFVNHAQVAFTDKFMVGSRIPIASIRTGFFTSVSVCTTDYSSVYKFEQGRLESLYQIARIAKSCDHENIVKFYGIAMSMEPVYFLTEHCIQGNLGYIVRRPGGPDVGKREGYAYGLAKGLKYLEDRFILHRNICIDNIFLDGKNQVKIGEFLNAVFGAKVKDKLAMISSRHLAPECVVDPEVRPRGEATFSVKSEIWAFGVVLWEIFHNGQTAYDDLDESVVALEVKKKNIRLRCHSDKFPNKLWKICVDCWASEPDNRPKMANILKEMEQEQRASSGLLDRVYESIALLME